MLLDKILDIYCTFARIHNMSLTPPAIPQVHECLLRSQPCFFRLRPLALPGSSADGCCRTMSVFARGVSLWFGCAGRVVVRCRAADDEEPSDRPTTQRPRMAATRDDQSRGGADAERPPRHIAQQPPSLPIGRSRSGPPVPSMGRQLTRWSVPAPRPCRHERFSVRQAVHEDRRGRPQLRR